MFERGMRCRSTKRPTELPGACRAGRFPASASLGRSRGSEGPRPAPEFSRTGRWLPPRLPIVGEREADLRVSVVVRVQNRAGDGHGWRCVVCSFPRPRPDLSVPKPPPQWASSSDRDLGRRTKPAGIEPWMTTQRRQAQSAVQDDTKQRAVNLRPPLYSMNQSPLPLNPSPVPAASLDE